MQTSVRNNIHTLSLTFEDGETIETTGEHPFYVEGEGFTPAGRLAIGNAIVTRAGPVTRLVRVVWNAAPKTVYNFTVAGDHTYFVGDKDGGLWVHNIICVNQLHHIYPQKFRPFFEAAGINIHNFTVSLHYRVHLAGVHGRGGFPFPNGLAGTTPGRYNRVWRNFINTNPNAAKQEIEAFAEEVKKIFGLDGFPVVHY